MKNFKNIKWVKRMEFFLQNKPWKGTFNKFMKERSLSSNAVFVMLAFQKSTVTNLGLSREAKSSTEFEFGGMVR